MFKIAKRHFTMGNRSKPAIFGLNSRPLAPFCASSKKSASKNTGKTDRKELKMAIFKDLKRHFSAHRGRYRSIATCAFARCYV
jgi:hypothetical protein